MDHDLHSLLPLNPRVFAILLVLLEGPAHGYRLKTEVEQRSDGALTLDPGSLYRTIAKLVDDGIIREVEATAESSHEDARRRYYGVTDRGRRLAAAEAGRLRRLLAQADRMQGWAEELGG
jgi:DNA-binding PadR family transcriptional regulator